METFKWGKLTLQWRIFSLFLIIFLVVLVLGGFYSYSLTSAGRDADLINDLGRQRMLSQSMAKSALGYAGAQSQKAAIKQQIRELDHYITQMRGVYTKHVVGPAKRHKIDITIDPIGANKKHPAIPFPATFTRMINKQFGKDRSFGIDIISDRPINPKKGLKTKSDREAFTALKHSGKNLHTLIQEEKGKLLIILYTADRATVKACVTCHTALTGRDTHLGDILGIRKYNLIFADDVELGKTELYATLEEYKTAKKLFASTLIGPITRVEDKEIQTIIPIIEGTFRELKKSVDVLVKSKVNSNPYRQAKVAILTSANILRTQSHSLVTAYSAYSKDQQMTIQWVVNICIAVTMLLLIGIGYYLLNKVIHPIEKITGILENSSQSLTSTSHQMSGSAEETSIQAGAVSTAAEQIAVNTNSVAIASEEMEASIKEISKNAIEAAEVTREAVKMSEATNITITQLGQVSAEIGDIVQLITSVAEQTNLLALNATIEAARAGEAGQGFAVVAGEVKELANKTAQATNDIRNKIKNIESNSTGAIEEIGGIKNIISRINDIATSIASAVEEQSVTSSEISRSIHEASTGTDHITSNISGVATAAKDTSEAALQTQKAATQIARMAGSLKQILTNVSKNGGEH